MNELRTMVARWRAITLAFNREEFPFLDGQAHGMLCCADELEAFLDSMHFAAADTKDMG